MAFIRYAEEKAAAFIPSALSAIKTRFISATTEWGNRFEPLALDVFNRQFKTTTIACSSIPHPHIPRLAASPDGYINSGIFNGHLIEIKCVVSRKLIENCIPFEYWCQM